jgi:hypothetical protein
MAARNITRKARSLPTQFNQEMEIFHFAPPGLIAPEHTLAFNTSLGTLSLLGWQNDHPRLIMEEQFTSREIAVLVPLLRTYPSYCPYEMILACYETGRLTEETVFRYRMRLHEAQQQPEVWDMMMRPMRGILSRARLKLRCFGLVVASVSETGYMLRGMAYVPMTQETTPMSIPG